MNVVNMAIKNRSDRLLGGSARAGKRSSGKLSDGKTYLIGDLAREFGVTLRTLRFYEDKGLLSPMRDGTTRIYGGRDRARLALILKGKHLGFTLTEIRAMLAREEDGSSEGELDLSLEQVNEQIAYLEGQKAEIEQALAELMQRRNQFAAGS